jgi:hypothetical protein
MDFKKKFNKKKYIDSISNIKNLKNILDKILQEKKYQDVINEDNVDLINKIFDKINELHLFDNENNEINNNENNNSNNNISSKEKEITKTDNPNKNGDPNKIETKNNEIKTQKVINKKGNILSEEQVKQLNNCININSLDQIYSEIKQKYISPYYEQKLSNKKSNDFRKDLKLILGNYIANSLEMKEEKDILYLGGDELEKTINDFNQKLMEEREKNSKVEKNIDICLFKFNINHKV